jgi:hypothetical protein
MSKRSCTKLLSDGVRHRYEYNCKKPKDLRCHMECNFLSYEEKISFQERLSAAKKVIGLSVSNTRLMHILLDAFQSKVESVQRSSSLSQPSISLLQPPTSLLQPPTSLLQPPTSLLQPPTSLMQPLTSLLQLPTSPLQLPTALLQPPILLLQPLTSIAQPSTSTVQPSTTSRQPAKSTLQPPSTSTLQPSTSIPQLSTSTLQPPTASLKSPLSVPEDVSFNKSFISKVSDIVSLINDVSSHGRSCKALLKVVSVRQQGHAAEMTLQCAVGHRCQWVSSSKMGYTHEVNYRLALAYLCSGMSHTQYRKFCDFSNIGQLSYRLFNALMVTITSAVTLRVKQSIYAAIFEEKRLTQEAGEQGIGIITDARHACRYMYCTVYATYMHTENNFCEIQKLSMLCMRVYHCTMLCMRVYHCTMLCMRVYHCSMVNVNLIVYQ